MSKHPDPRPFLEHMERMFVELTIEAEPENRAYAVRARDLMSLLVNVDDDDERPNLVSLGMTIWLLTIPPGHRNEAMKSMLTHVHENVHSITKAIREAAGKEKA